MLRAVRQFRKELAGQRQALSDNVANLRSQSDKLVAAAARLNGTGLDLQAGHPPVSILLDNMHNLMFRRTYRENGAGDPQGPAVLLFYGAE